MIPEHPNVSVVIPLRNEEDWIELCLDSVLAQDYPTKLIEVITVDGESDDRTLEILASYGNRVRVLNNPGRIVPSAMNIGIRSARGDIICRVDAHTVLRKDYVRHGVDLLLKTQADNVGGAMTSIGGGRVGDAVALAMSSRFGIGAYFHFGTEECEVDTVYMGMYPRSVFERIGLFDEELVRNQDDELNYRLRKSGGRVLFTPQMRSRYQNRQSWKKFAKQFYQYGLWKVRVLQKHPRQMNWRHFVPPAFVASLGGGLLLAPICQGFAWLSLAVALSYVVTLIAASVAVTRKKGATLFVLVAMAFAVMHFCWGSGFLMGLFRFAKNFFTAEKHPPVLAARPESQTG